MREQTLTIEKTNGESFIISSNDHMKVLNFLAPSPFYNTDYDNFMGRHGEIDLGGRFEARDNIRCQILFYSRDIWDFYLFRNEIFRLFASQEPFYITTNREPGKRWKVRVASKYEIDPQANGNYGVFDIIFKSASPFSESRGTTLSPMTFDSNLWQIGQGLLAEELKYTHSTTSFSIYNASDVEVDPRSMPLKIKYTGASNNLSIKNVTTGDIWSYTGSSLASGVIELNGVKSFKNGSSIFGNTNFQLIRIAPGWNDFVLTGASGSFTIQFDFRFYYL